MPCSDGQGSYYNEYVERIRLLERFLCEACAILEPRGFMTERSPDLKEWWENHQREDRERKERDEKRRRDDANFKSGYAKLNQLEQKILDDLLAKMNGK